MLVSVLAAGGAVFLTLFATLLWTIDCHEDSYSTCSTEGRVQFWLAVADLIPAVGGLIAASGRSLTRGSGSARPCLST